MLPLEDEAAVDLIAQHHDIAIADCARDAVDIFFPQYPARWVLRRIQDDELGPVIDQPAEFVDVEPEIHFLAQTDRYGFCADIVDHRFVDGESGIRIDDFVPFFNKRENGEEDDGFTAGDYDHFFGRNVYPTRLTHVLSDRLTQLWQAG